VAGAYKQSDEYLGRIKRGLADVCSLPEESAAAAATVLPSLQ